jgi:aspartate aminotransferase
VIGFGAGEPDFPTPAHIVEAAVAACRDTANHRYTPTAGLPALREAIAVKTKRDSGFEATASQVLVTNGGKQAIANAFAVLCDPGDEVIVLAPFWTTYPEAIALAGGVPVIVSSDETTGFRSSVADLEAAWTPRTKVLLFVSPSNPTGAVYGRDEIEAIGRWAVERGIWVLTDEIYEHLVYGGAAHHSMPVLVPELADRCLIANGVAKTYAMTGWRVGWLIGPTDAITAATNIQSHETSNVGNVSQRAALAAVSGDLEAVAMMRKAFDERRQTIQTMLNQIDGVDCVEPQGAFYAFPSVKGLLGRELRGQRPTSSTELAEICIDQAKVAVVPGEAFGAPGYFRMSYALGLDDLVEGVSRLAALFAEAH